MTQKGSKEDIWLICKKIFGVRDVVRWHKLLMPSWSPLGSMAALAHVMWLLMRLVNSPSISSEIHEVLLHKLYIVRKKMNSCLTWLPAVSDCLWTLRAEWQAAYFPSTIRVSRGWLAQFFSRVCRGTLHMYHGMHMPYCAWVMVCMCCVVYMQWCVCTMVCMFCDVHVEL